MGERDGKPTVVEVRELRGLPHLVHSTKYDGQADSSWA